MVYLVPFTQLLKLALIWKLKGLPKPNTQTLVLEPLLKFNQSYIYEERIILFINLSSVIPCYFLWE